MLLVVLASGGTTRVTETGGLTTIALIVTAIFAVLVIVGILYGARQKRIRAAAEAEEKQRAAEMIALDDAPAAAPSEPAPQPAVPPPPAEQTPAKAEVPAKAEPAPEPKPKAAPTPKAATQAPAAEPVAKPKAAPKPRAKPAAAAAPAAPEPVATPAPAAEPASASYALTDVKGLGPKAAGLLTGLGVADVAALAALDPARAAEVDGQLGAFSGRLTRDRWVEQAKLLAAGDISAFEATYGKL